MLHACLTQQHFQAGVAGLGHFPQPFGHDDAVFAHNRHHIRHRAQRDQVGIAVQHRVRVACQRADQLKRHAHACQTVERIGAVRPLIVHNRIRVRQRIVALVVVGDHHLHAKLARHSDLLVRRDARIHCDQQAGALLIELFHRLARQAVALAQTVGDVIFAYCADAAQIIHHDTGCSDAVHIIVPIDYNMLAPADRAADYRGGLFHIGHKQRVVQAGAVAAEIGCRRLRRVDPARGQNRGGKRRITARARQRVHARRVGRGDHPSLCFHRNSLIYFLLGLLYQNIPKSSRQTGII